MGNQTNPTKVRMAVDAAVSAGKISASTTEVWGRALEQDYTGAKAQLDVLAPGVWTARNAAAAQEGSLERALRTVGSRSTMGARGAVPLGPVRHR